MRYAKESNDYLISFINITDQIQEVVLPLNEINLHANFWTDLLSYKNFQVKNNKLRIQLQPYQIIWLKNSDK